VKSETTLIDTISSPRVGIVDGILLNHLALSPAWTHLSGVGIPNSVVGRLRMHLQAKLISGFCFVMATIPIPRTLSAQQKEAATGAPLHMVVSVEPKHGNEVPTITQQDVIVSQGHDRRPVTSWVPATGDRAGLELAILIDDSAGFSFGSQIDDIRAFITEQAPTTLIAVGYMHNGTVSLAQNFTQDHAAASKSLRLPQGFIGAEASPYFSLTDFIKRWPANPSLPRREVLMITSGIDTFYGGGYPDPYVDTAVQDAQCAGIVVFSIYTPGAGHFGHTYWRIYWAQNYLAQLSEETGGESYYFLGAQAPVAFQPYLNQMSSRLTHQFLLTFLAKPENKAGTQPVKVSTEIRSVDLVAPDKVCVPASQEH